MIHITKYVPLKQAVNDVLVRPSYNIEHTLRLDSTDFFRNS